MPRVSQWMVRTSLVWLLSGYTIAGLLLANKALGLYAPIWSLRATHAWMLLIGWLVQLSAGVMVWIMPRYVQTGDRGDLRLVWVMFVALNTGMLMAALHPPLSQLVDPASLRWMSPLAGVLLLAAVFSFIFHIWRRVRPFVDYSLPAANKKSS
jgi:heme/copper-type cytochrome/quinol oxidase subunit 1